MPEDLEFPYEPTIVTNFVEYYLAEHHNRQARQISALTDRVNRFWADDAGRPTPKDPEDKFPLGYNVARAAYEFWSGTAWLQLPGAVVGAFLGLTDTPGSYEGQSGKIVAVKATEDGLEFITEPGGESAYAGSFEQGSPPTVIQIPDGKWGYWENIGKDPVEMILVRNRGGVMYGVEASPID